MCGCGAPSPCHRSPGPHRGGLGPGRPTPAVSRGLVEWSLPIEQLGAGAKYYQYDPKEAKRLLAEAGYPKGFKTPLIVSSGYGRDLLDEAQLIMRYLKDVGIEAELKTQEHGAYVATTIQGKYEGLIGALSASPGNRIAGCIAPMPPSPP